MSESIPLLWQKILIAILIGLFVGVERERAKSPNHDTFAGIRTYPLISILGFVTALISSFTSIYVFILGFFIFGVLVAIEYYITASKGELGGTTELTLLLVYVLGGLVYWDYLLLSAALSVIITMFLSLKTKFRAFAGKIEEEDIFATLKFAIITIIVLPLLPDKTFDPFNVLNPLKIWYLVVLISAINFVGYILFKIIGTKKGILILSILGGLASSTAVTLSFSQRSKESPSLSADFSSGILLATAVMYPRVLLIVFLFSPAAAFQLSIPFLILTLICIIVSLRIWKNTHKGNTEDLKLTNPFKLLFAVKFGLIFAIILFVSSFANSLFGDNGVYMASFIGGFASLDAAVLSVMDISNKLVSLNVISAAILMAIGANTIFKMFLVGFGASKALKNYTYKVFITILITISLFSAYYIFL
ncbi:MAG: MgtC/SapB family protein [bacterium]